jgi:hypothetical protein
MITRARSTVALAIAVACSTLPVLALLLNGAKRW